MRFIPNSTVWPSFSRTSHPGYEDTRLSFARGEGAFLFDVQGNRYFDAFSTLWTNLVGHGREEIIAAMAEQSRKLSFMHLFSGTTHEPAVRLADRLCQLSPFGHTKVFFGCSGSDATETSMKMARAYWHYRGKAQKNIIVARRSTYHGVSFGALSLMGHDSYQTPYMPLVPETHRVPPCDISALESYFREVNAKERVAAFLIEPIITSDGLVLADQAYWSRVKTLCEENDVLLISDEVSTGMGRVGQMFASTLYGLKPQILYLAKSLTSGYAPLSAVLTTEEIFRTIHAPEHYFTHGSTFAGHPASCVAALKVLEIVERAGLVERARLLGAVLGDELRRVATLDLPWHVQVSGEGTLYEVVLKPKQATKPGYEVTLGMHLYNELLKRGQYVRVLANDLCFAPPLIATEEQIRELGAKLGEAMKAVAGRRS